MRGSRSFSFRPAGSLALALCLLAAPATARTVSRDLRALSVAAGGQGRVDVIVTYHGSPGAQHRRQLERDGAEGVRDLRLVRGMAASLPVASLDRLAGDPDVRSVVVDERVFASADVAVPATGAYLARQALGLDGAGVRVAILDSGVAPVPDLGAGPDAPLGRIVAWVDLVEPHRRAPSDPYGHGTHVAGIIAGALHEVHDTGSRVLYGGMAPAAEIVSVRVLDRRGQGRTSDVIAGLDWIVNRAADLGIRVVNLSLGHPVREPGLQDPLVQAVERASEAGLLVVTSAGNHGREADPMGTITSPGNAPSALTVGALSDRDTASRSDDRVATYSSPGPTAFDHLLKPDLLAPGDSLVSLRSPHSTLDRTFPDNRVGSESRRADSPDRFRLSGTSMAAAVASGAAALLFCADPDLDASALKARLMSSAERRDESVYHRGAGALDVMAALDELAGAGDGASPPVRLDGAHIELQVRGDGWTASDLYGPVALWDLDLAWHLLQDVEPADEEELVWQVPSPQDRIGAIRWERVPTPASESVVWQVRSDSVVWQGNGRALAESVVWQNDGKTQAESVVWQNDGRAQAESVVWQNDGRAQGESVVWQNDGKTQGESVVWQNDGKAQGESVVWQNDGKTLAESVVWQNDGRAQGESVVWQNDGKTQAESVVWQNDGKTQAESVVWQNDGKTQAESVVWQNDLQSESVVWQSDWTVSASSVVWQGSAEATDILIRGDQGSGR